ncbi:MAG: beta (1-6) glucan synthase [Methylotenera sp.]|uniref:glycoside hydrolase family 17 protein n=1 Tax=Methylotenera sp. TaxID=2051956 RepID=UPI00272F0259|nr:beta (1-6) glucan synthase [Methylotenera sp.]MDP1522042.1 beta (1-6) glucan synthase [Methylotenera sp.]
MTISSPKPTWHFTLFNITLLTLLSIWLWQQNQATAIIEPQLPDDGKLQCVSYSPYYQPGQTPLNPNTLIDSAQIDQDLTLLSKQFNCVRIYSVSQGLDYVPEAASKLGMQVYLGAWIGWVKALNDKELDLAIAVANKHPKTIKALIVGNEVLLRGEQTEAAMKAYLTKAKQATHVPVTYADVWEFWRKHPALEDSVDFVTVHILPYWEDNPQPIEHALDHASNVMNLLKDTFKKPILIGETGWPSVGRQRQGSQPGVINQAIYMRGFLQLAHDKNWNYNLIEAIDQPWKRKLEGTVGGYWGIYNTNLTPKFLFNGDVKARADGLRPLLFGGLGALLFLGLSLYLNERRKSALIALASLGALFGISTLLQTEYLLTACQNRDEWLALGGVAVTGWIAIISIIWTVSKANANNLRLLQVCLTLLLLAAITLSMLLIIDGRYRDFSISLYALPAIQLSLGLYLLKQNVRPKLQLYFLLHVLLIVSAAYCLYLEPKNLLAALWLAISMLIAAGTWPKRQLSTH